ncbi:MAG: VWA domain-containing protein [Planctomycetes bacterium]|nr:VWA domain-containing protein [Planctomycetota bacterium]
MAVISEAELARLQADAPGGGTPAVPEMLPTELDTIHAPEVSGGGESPREGVGMGDLGTLTGGGDVSAGGGLGLGGSGSGGGGTSFFGIEASGNRFAYLVDVSSSMQGKRLLLLQQELTKSVHKMDAGSEFIMVAFASDKQVLGERTEWREASESGKRWARAQIGLLAANGNTEPLSGFKVLFTMRPRPDAIFFMTDGEFDPAVVKDVADMNAKLRIPIHCICLGSKQGEEQMKTIAEQSRGTYRFVPEP